MKTVRIDFNFENYSVPALIVFAERVSKNVKRNTFFSDIRVIIEDLDDLRGYLLLYYNEATYNENVEHKALINQTQEDLIKVLKIVSRYVNRIANGDQTVICSCGFHLEEQTIDPMY